MRNAVTMAFVAGVVALSGAARAGDSEEITPREALLAGVQAAKARLSDRVEMTISTRTVGTPTGKPVDSANIYVYRRSGERFGTWGYPDEEALETGLHDSRKICDGERRLSCRACVDSRTDKGRATLAPAPDDINPFGSHWALSMAGWVENGESPERALLSENCTVSAKPVEIDGVAAYEVAYERNIDEDEYRMVCWLAPALSCMPVAMEVHTNGIVFMKWRFSDFKEVSRGFWIPSVSRKQTFHQDGTLWFEFAIEAKQIIVDAQIDESLFEVDTASVPEGYFFDDYIHGVSYVIGQGPVSDHAVAKVVSHIDADFPGLLEELAAGTPERLDDAALAETEPEAPGVSLVDERPAATAAPAAPESRVPWIAFAAGASVLAAAAFLLLLFARGNRTVRKAKP